MKEAKARKPNLKLYGLPWGFPGWLDPDATPAKPAKNAFANANVTANYTLSWLEAAKEVHGLHIDYMGQWNERDAPEAYNDALRRVVGESKVLGGKTTVLNRLPHYPGTSTTADSRGCTQHQWNTTDGSLWVDEEGSIFDGRSARCLARCVNRQYVTGCHTATFQWHLISSFYDYLPWSRCGVAVANEPWSGNYEITSPLWALAHTTQFAQPGWRYLAHGSGVYMLKNGGSMVTRVATDGSGDFSIVVEKMTTENSVCARGSNPKVSVGAEKMTITLDGGLLAAAQAKGLHVWKSNLASPNDEGVNPPENQVFQKQSQQETMAAFDPRAGSLTLQVEPEEIYTITTLAGGAKGTPAKWPPAPKAPLPLPYTQAFDTEEISSPPYGWYDQMGAWEVQEESQDGSTSTSHSTSSNRVMRQISPVWPACWGYSCSGPLTYFGARAFNVSANAGFAMKIHVKLEQSDAAFSFVVADDQSEAGITLDSAAGTFTISRWGKGEKPLTGQARFNKGAWHTVAVSLTPETISASLDGVVLGNTTTNLEDAKFSVKMGLDKYVYAAVDNFEIN